MVIVFVASSSVPAAIPVQIARQLVKPGAKVLAGSSLTLAGIASSALCYGLAFAGKGIEEVCKHTQKNETPNATVAVLNSAFGLFGNATSVVASVAGVCSLGTTFLGAQIAKNGVKAMRMILRK